MTRSASPRLAVVTIAVVALAVAACGSTTSSAAPTAAVSAPPTPAPSVEAATSAAPSPGASVAPSVAATPAPTFTRDPALEALLPTTIDGVPMQVVSLTGSDVLGGGIASNQNDLAKLLGALGKQPADLRFASSADPKRALPVMIGVYTVDGVAGSAVATAIVDLIVAADPTAKKTTETLGGKEVILLERTIPTPSPAPGASPSPPATYLDAFYASGDKLFRVSAATRSYVSDGLLTLK